MYKISTTVQTSKELKESIELSCCRYKNKILTNITLHNDDCKTAIVSLSIGDLEAIKRSIDMILDEQKALNYEVINDILTKRNK